MKTKTEIKTQIQLIRQHIKDHHHLPKYEREAWEIITRCQIQALEWVLGYKTKCYRYWCSSCNIPHYDKACPKCGSTRTVEDEKVAE